MKIKTVAVEKVIPYARNPRKNEDAISKVSASLKEYGWQQPIVVDAEMVVIAGHTRLEAAKRLGMTEVPVHIAENLSEAQVKAYRIADNRVSQEAEWDIDLLKIELGDLENLDFDLSLTGFDDDELNQMLAEIVEEGLVDDDEVPAAPENPVSVLGDVWMLGNHRLMCGDSTSIDAVDKLMPETANMIFTDPPYLMDFTGGIHADGSKSFNAKHGGIKNDKMSKEDGNNFLDAINSVILAKVDGAFYITFYRLGIDQYYASFSRTGLKCRSLIIWDKGNHTLSNSDYMSMYEPMFYGWVKSHKFYGGKNGMDIWRIKRTAKNDLHPTMKPVELCQKAVEDGSQINGIVLDLFGGSGSTLIACEKSNRICRMMELDPKYCDVIIKRWQDFTGKKAIHADSGSFFDDFEKKT